MSAAKKLDNIQTHVVDILGSTKGRDQPIMKMDKAVELVKCLDREILESDDYVFFDPFCKAGEILLATALVSNAYKNESKKIVSLEDIKKDIYESNRYFALAPDERHYKLSLRTFYGNENSHKKVFMENMRNGNYLSEEDGKLDEKRFNKELTAMLEYIKEKSGDKKIIAVGNPPYQEDTGGFKNQAKPVYHLMLNELTRRDFMEEAVFVIPARWFSGGMGLGKFRRDTLHSNNVKSMVYFDKSEQVFPTVDIRGGVCFFNWTKSKVQKTIIKSGNEIFEDNLSKYDIVVPDKKAQLILEKVLGKAERFVSEVMLPIGAFGLPTNYFNKVKKVDSSKVTFIDCVTVGKKIHKINLSILSKYSEEIYKYNVAFPEAIGGGKNQRHKVLPKPDTFFILNKGQVTTATYCLSKGFKKRVDADNFRLFLGTAFARFLLYLRKPTQHTSPQTFSWVPLMDFSIRWTDGMLFEHFQITLEEQKYIKEKVDYLTA